MAYLSFLIGPESYLVVNISTLFFVCQNDWHMEIGMAKIIQNTQNTLKNLIKIESIAYHISDSKKSWDLVTSQDENSTWAVQSRVTLENMIT